MTTDEVLGVEEVAALLRCAPTTVEECARTGKLPGLLFGDGGYVFPRDTLFAALNELAAHEAARKKERRVPTAIATAQSPTKAKRTPPRLA